MNILDIYRYLRNYITVSVYGGFTERFINLCNREKIYLWDSFYCKGELTVKMYCSDFKKLIGIRRKSGVKIKIVKKCGINFFIKENRKRKIMAAGLAAALAVMLIMNNFVWSIEVKGAERIDENEITEALRNAGLKYGTFVPAFDEKRAGRDAVNLSEGKLLWLAVNIKGSKATVEVRDYIKPENQTNDGAPCNIVADFDGIILSAYTHCGVQVAQSGAAVKKGDLIISGVTEKENGGVDYLCADGEITALHEEELKIKFNNKADTDVPVNLKSVYTLRIFGVDIPLYINTKNNAKNIDYTKFLTFDGNVIPVGVKKAVLLNTESSLAPHCCTLEQIDEFTSEEYRKFRNSKITNADYSFRQLKNGLNISGKYVCLDFMGTKVKILKES